MSAQWLAQAESRRQKGELLAKMGDQDLVIRKKRSVKKEENVKPKPMMEEGGMVSKKSSSWISHVKAYQSQHGCSYREAMMKAKATYQK